MIKKITDKWETKKLGEICELVKGKKPELFVLKSHRPYLTAKVVRKTEIPKFASKDCLSCVWVKKEDIVIIMDGSNSGEMFTGLYGALASTMGIIKYPKDLFFSKYLLHFLITHRENFTKSRTGATIPHLNKDEFEKLEIPIPSLLEQNRIVKILDKVFNDIDKAKENVEKNLQNAKELFESYLQSIFTNHGNDWKEKDIGEMCNLMTGGTPSRSKKEYFLNGNIKWLVSGDVNMEEIFDCDGRITKIGMQNSNTKYLPVNSVIIALNGQGKTRGTVALLRTKATCNQSLVSIYPKNIEIIIPEYIYYNLKVRYNEIRKITGDNGNDRRGLNMPLLRRIKISFPKSISAQRNLVSKFNFLSTEIKNLDAIYKKNCLI